MTQELLLTVPESLSPFLQWKAKHGFWTHYSEGCEEPWTAFASDVTMEIVAERCSRLEGESRMCQADSEHDALMKLAQMRGIPNWLEEQMSLTRPGSNH